MLRLTAADVFELIADPSGSMYAYERAERRGEAADAFREYSELYREQEHPAGVSFAAPVVDVVDVV